MLCRGVNPNDIALIELKSELEFNDAVKPVDLPNKDDIPTGMSTLSGWGSISNTTTPNLPSMLQTVDVPLLNYDRKF